MPTERLYYTDAYLTEFDARVTAIDGARVQLDRSAFYPTSGGQQFDTGTLGNVPVVDVVDDGDAVTHVLATPPGFAAGDPVTGSVNRARRIDHMQQHTGQHLLSALFEDLCRAPTVSVHFGDATCTLDVDAAISRDAAARVEAHANVIVAENRPVTVSFEDAAAATGLRKASDRSGTLRIVTIGALDRSACGGTHVRATGEIGPVLVRRLEKYKALTRVEFLCGARPVARARADYDALTAMAAALSAGIDELPTLVASNAESLRALQSERRKLAEALATHRARDLHGAAAPDAGGVRRIVVESASPDELRALAHAVAALERAVFIGTCGAPPTVVVSASPDSGVNAGSTLKAALAAHGGRGGGNEKVAQGTVAERSTLPALVAALSG
ncbi:MAG: DHHA1 domain-containing protein [Gemmatimonadota bacterium]|nr:DHHA1 domain-containing protein [Gemmatimonadota bacterium]